MKLRSIEPFLGFLLLSALPAFAASIGAQTPTPPAPSPLEGYTYDEPFFPGAKYDKGVPTPDSILGFTLGSGPASPAQIEAVITALAKESKRAKLVRYGTTHEGRPLHYLVLASEANIARLDALRGDLAKLADPRAIDAAAADKLAEKLPVVAWMAYTIHGNELSSSDAALAAAYHLAAGNGDDVKALLAELVVIIDPLMNPDGRERYLTMAQQNRTAQPSIDDQSVLHSEIWPSGRMNHYLFDMNRDWLWATQPETRGRIAAISQWNPHFFMESHEQFSQDTFLFLPPREPINPHFPEHTLRWAEAFAQDHAAAFDARGWRYYTGEWSDNWYPGYSSSWAPLRGAIANLYEQARIHTDAVRREDGTLETYRESVHKQLVSTMVNLGSLAKNRRAVVRDFLAEKRACVAADAPHAQRTFVLPPSANTARWAQFLDLLHTQGIEYQVAEKGFTASGTDRLSLAVTDREFPAGTVLIPGRQPLARLVATLLEFDPRMKTETLVEERRELLRFNRSRFYDITGWSATMLYDLECVTLAGEPPAAAAAKVASTPPARPAGRIEKSGTTVGWVIDGADDASVVAAGRLMERGVRVRVSNKSFTFDSRAYARGSVVVTRKDNTFFKGGLEQALTEVVQAAGATATGLISGMGPGDIPDLGGEHFVLQHAPRIAVVGRDPFSPYSYGECWYVIDHVLGLRASYIDFGQLGGTDLRRYNVIVLPAGDASALKDQMESLRAWVQAGGTLIAIESSAEAVAVETAGIGSIRLLPDILAKPEPYLQAVIREWEGRTAEVDAATVWSFTAPSGERATKFPWKGAAIAGDDSPSEDEIKRRDAWRKIFMPQGSVLAGRVDDRSWLTAGCGEFVPVMYASGVVLAVPPGVEAPVRAGHFTVAPPPPEPPVVAAEGDPKPDAARDDAAEESKDKEAEEPPPGWTIAPPGHELRLRMSGLLWPEAAERLANSALLAREGVGSGQVILFAFDPVFRASTPGTARVFTNAVVYGPGMGARQPIVP
ncbi:MAG: peptidase [Opitutaceae bacterium]|nr:peptidase [Opitutaceae bacterium]